MDNMKITNPPHDRDFLGLVVIGTSIDWRIFHWAKHGVNDLIPTGFFDSRGFKMPSLLGWSELPYIPHYVDSMPVISVE